MPIEIFKGAELYVVSQRKRFKLDSNIYIDKVQKHSGHIRFSYKEITHALTYEGNRGKYKWVKATKETVDENDLEGDED